MKITFTSFDLLEWHPDTIILNGKDDVQINPQDSISWGTITGFSKEIPASVGRLGLHWIYELFDKNTEKRVLKFTADDTWFVNLEDRTTDDEELDKVIQESYNRFSTEYDVQKQKQRIIRAMPTLGQAERDQIRVNILNSLKMKGF